MSMLNIISLEINKVMNIWNSKNMYKCKNAKWIKEEISMNGILYIASGQKYYNEAIRGIKRTKKVMPSVPIALCTDWEEKKKCEEIDYYIKLEQPSYS